MKFSVAIAGLLPLLSLSLNINNDSSLGRAITCPSNQRSCMSSSEDTCCSPKLGLIVLALQWIPNYGPNDQFTIHGLWPNNCDGSFGPSNGCDASRQYTNLQEIVSKDSNLLNQMNTYWPSYKGDNPAFWQHEWGKHGTCLSTVEPRCYAPTFDKGQDARDYFYQALNLRTKFNLYKTLADKQIVPGRTYPKTAITNALNSLGAQVILKCTGSTISEVQIYFYVNGKSDYVITNASNSGNCPTNINYPKKTT